MINNEKFTKMLQDNVYWDAEPAFWINLSKQYFDKKGGKDV